MTEEEEAEGRRRQDTLGAADSADAGAMGLFQHQLPAQEGEGADQ